MRARQSGHVIGCGARGFSGVGACGQRTCRQVITEETAMKHMKVLSREAMPAKGCLADDLTSVKDAINGFLEDPVDAIQQVLEKDEA